MFCEYSNEFVITPKRLNQSQALANLQSKILKNNWPLPSSGATLYHYILFKESSGIPTYIFFTEGKYKGEIPIKKLSYSVPSSPDDVENIKYIAQDIIFYIDRFDPQDPQKAPYIKYMKRLLKDLKNYYETILEL